MWNLGSLGANNRQHFPWAPIVPLEKITSRSKQSLLRCKQLTMGDFATNVSPHPLNGIEPGAVGRQVEQHQASGSPSHHLLHFLILMGIDVVPSDVNGSCRVPLQQRREQLGDLLASFMELEVDDRFSRVRVHRANPILLVRLGGRGDLHLLTFRAPHGAQRGEPAQIELICIRKHAFPL